MMLEAYVAVMAALLTGGLVLLAAGLRGTSSPPAVVPPAVDSVRRWWRGAGRTGTSRRGRQLAVSGAMGAGLAGFTLTGVPAVALLAAAAVPTLPWLWNAGRREQRAIVRAEAVGQWTDRLKDQLATGSGLVAAIVTSADTAPPPVSQQVRALASRVRAGMHPQHALRQFADEVDDSVAEQVVAALLLHLEDRGEHLSEVLTALSADAARVVAMRREVDAKRAQPRMTVRFMIVLAGVVTVALAYTGLLPVYRTASGQLILLAMAGAFAAVLTWVHAMSTPPAAQRLLAPTLPARP